MSNRNVAALVAKFTEATGYKDTKEWAIAISGYTVALFPGKGVIPAGLVTLGAKEPIVMTLNLCALTALSPFLLASGYKLVFKGKTDVSFELPKQELKERKKIPKKKLWKFAQRTDEPSITACGMKMDLTDLFTNILIIGSIGSGKTSAAIFPILEALFELFADEDYDIESENPYKQIGGLYLDVKGEFYEGIVYCMNKAGRNFGKDLFIISPYPYIKVLKVRDVENGNILFISAQLSSRGGCLTKFLASAEDPSVDVKTDYIENTSEFSETNEFLKGKIFKVSDCKLRYLTWREEKGKLVRARCQEGHKRPYYHTPNGRQETIPLPKRVEYLDLIAQRRIHSFNIIDPERKPIEVGKRLSTLGSLSKGGDSGGSDKNQYFYDVAERALQKGITLLRIIYPNRDVEPTQVLHMVTKPDFTSDQIKVANQKIRDLEEEKKQIEERGETNGFDYRRVLEEISTLEESIHYWSKTWTEEDQKQKGTFINIIENMFSIFTMDANLQETFCRSRTYSFDDCCNRGTNFVFVAGKEYEESSRLIATALKLEFQDAMLNRLKSARMDKTRLVVFGNDEAQKNIVAGGVSGKGDEQFMSLSRAAKVLNLIATQSYKSIDLMIGRDKGAVYRQSFGLKIWFQNDDEFSNAEASRICGSIKKEEVETEGEALTSTSIWDAISGNTRGKPSRSKVKMVKKPRFEAEDFINLKKLESITFNKGEENTHDKVVRTKNKFSEVTNPNSTIIPELMRDYYQHSTEFAILEAEEFANYNPRAATKEEESPAQSSDYHVMEESQPEAGDAGLAEAEVDRDGTVRDRKEGYNTPVSFGPLVNSSNTLEVVKDDRGAEIVREALNSVLGNIQTSGTGTTDEPGQHSETDGFDPASLVMQSEKRVRDATEKRPNGEIEEDMESAGAEESVTEAKIPLKPSDVVKANAAKVEAGLGNLITAVMKDFEIDRLPDVTSFIYRTRAKVPDSTDDTMVATKAVVGPRGTVKGDIKIASRIKPRISQVDSKEVLSGAQPKEISADAERLIEAVNNPAKSESEKRDEEEAQKTPSAARRYLFKKK